LPALAALQIVGVKAQEAGWDMNVPALRLGAPACRFAAAGLHSIAVQPCQHAFESKPDKEERKAEPG